MFKLFLTVAYTFLLLFTSTIYASELTGFAAIEARQFFNDPLHAGQKSNNNVNFILEPEYYHLSKNEQHSFVFKPFFRTDHDDANRQHFDIRELNWQYLQDQFELRVGITKIFWGVTESNHLVDIINQTDAVEDIDGEDKLGQPMVKFSFFREYGNFSFFYLPYFRERTFHSASGRLRPEISVLEDETLYESSAKEKHQDFAFRYDHVIGNMDLGLSYFSGTSREAKLILSTDINGNHFKPLYNLINQFGIDIQYTQEAALWKLEAIHREGHGRNFIAYTAGIEYSFYDILQKNIDIGILTEHQFDDRDNTAPITNSKNNIFSGLRLTFNDVNDTQLLAGIIIDSSSEINSYFIEASRRISNNWKLELDGRIFQAIENQIYKDDFIQLRLSRFF